MADFTSAKAEIKTYLIARTPLIILDTSERERAERILRQLSSEMNIPLHYYTDTTQVTLFPEGAKKDVDSDPLPFLAETFKKNHGATFALSDCRRLGDDNAFSRELLGILYLAKERACTVILITPDPVWQRLARFGMLTKLDLPSSQERTAAIEAFAKHYGSRFPIEWSEEDIRMATALLRGFSEIQIENILSSTLVKNGCLNPSHLSSLTAQKEKLTTPVSCISQVSVDPSLYASGLSGLKAWLNDQKPLFFAPDSALQTRALRPPKGALLTGIPGCGKSLSAKMIAREWSLPLYRFDIGSVYDKWVGESEKKMKDALTYIDSVSPCIVWIDEIEKALAVSGAGDDIGKRVLGQFLFWLQESPSRVFLIATANDISTLPPELFRKGRFDEIFFLDLPKKTERAEAITKGCNRSLHVTLTPEQLTALVSLSEGFSFADIDHAVSSLARIALLGGQSAVTFPALLSEFENALPISRSSPELVSSLQEWGKKRAKAASGANEQ